MLYDRQAARYDDRAGMPEDCARAIASSIGALADLGPDSSLLEVGAGTGLLAIHLLTQPLRYIGFDSSAAMLDIFRTRIGSGGLHADLVVADANRSWPAADRSIDLVFSSRALHHVAIDHAVDEISRVLRPGGWLVVGKVRRPEESMKSVMRRRMRRALAQHGVEGRSHDRTTEAVFAELERRGGQRVAAVVAAQWTVRHRPIDSIASWQEKDGLAGDDIDPAIKSAVLDDVRLWAIEQFGSLDASVDQQECFELYAIRAAIA